MIIWWFFMVIWLQYLIIWLLFEKWLLDDYLTIWYWLFIIILLLFDPNYSWFDDYLISWPAAGWLVCFTSLHSQMPQHGTAWWWQPFAASFACANHSRLVLLAAEATDQLKQPSCLSCQLRPAERFASLRPHCFSARGTGPSHYAKSDGIQHPAHESLL